MVKVKDVYVAKRFKDTRTGDIVTSFNILDIKYMMPLDD